MTKSIAWIGTALVGFLASLPTVRGSEIAKLARIEPEEAPVAVLGDDLLTPPLYAQSYSGKLGQYPCSAHKIWSWLTYSSSRPKLCNCCYQGTTDCPPPLYAFFPCPNGNGCSHGTPCSSGKCWHFSMPSRMCCPNWLKLPWKKSAEEIADPEPIIQAGHKSSNKKETPR